MKSQIVAFCSGACSLLSRCARHSPRACISGGAELRAGAPECSIRGAVIGEANASQWRRSLPPRTQASCKTLQSRNRQSVSLRIRLTSSRNSDTLRCCGASRTFVQLHSSVCKTGRPKQRGRGAVELSRQNSIVDTMSDFSTRVSPAGAAAERPLPQANSSTSCTVPPTVGDNIETLVVVGRPRGQPSTATTASTTTVEKFPKQIQEAVSKVSVIGPILVSQIQIQI